MLKEKCFPLSGTRLLALGLTLLIGLAAPGAGSAQGIGGTSSSTILDIQVQGNQRIEAETVRSYMVISRGDEYDAAEVDRSLKALFATGLFADVTITRRGQSLIVDVIENPIINRIIFEGNDKLKSDDLGEEAQLRPRIVYTRAKVQSDVQRMMQLYRRSGRFAATIDPKVVQLPQNRVDLIYEIKEGEVTGVSRINFLGNKRFSDGDLRDVMVTQESRWWKFLTSEDNYDPDRLAFDQEQIRKHYFARGYADFRIVSAVAELTRNRESFFITITVDEGERYTIGDVRVESALRDLSPRVLTPLVITKPGDIYNDSLIDSTIDFMTFLAGRMGYAFIDIRSRISKHPETQTLDIVYEVIEGPRTYVERIEIHGNMRTLDTVIRREFRLAEGDSFNTQKLERSRQRIRALGFFSNVEVEQRPGSREGRTIIDVEVEETSTGELSLGAGFSGTENFIGELSIRERNLLGRGQDLRLRLSVSSLTQQIDLSFTEPFFMNRDVSAGIDLFTRQQDLQFQSGFDQSSTGFGLRFGFAISEFLRVGTRYSFRRDRIGNVSPFASRFVIAQQGAEVISSVGYSLLYDITDDALVPTNGYRVILSQDLAGLGGTVKNLRSSISFDWYKPIWKDFVAKLALTEGYIMGIGEDVKLNNRFFIGGDSFRGFEPGGIGPRDINTGDALGGNLYYVGEAEINFPFGPASDLGVRGAFYINAGSLVDVDDKGAGIVDKGAIRVTAGVGISWRSPFGPIRIDFAKAVRKQDFDETEVFRFSVGSRF